MVLDLFIVPVEEELLVRRQGHLAVLQEHHTRFQVHEQLLDFLGLPGVLRAEEAKQLVEVLILRLIVCLDFANTSIGFRTNLNPVLFLEIRENA